VEAKREIKEVRIALHIPGPIYCSDRIFSYTMLGENGKITKPVTLL
jgi:hypothetical protein